MGKYAVRFGLEARQFCSGGCLEEFKKGLKSCSYCQLDITKSTNSVVVSISDKPSSVKVTYNNYLFFLEYIETSCMKEKK